MGFDFKLLASRNFELPDKWRVATIGDVAVINEVSIQNDYRYEWIEYIDIASVERGIVNSMQRIRLKDAPSRARRIVHDNDTLIATVRPNLEHFVFIKRANPNLVASTGFAVVTVKKADPRFIYYYLTSKPFSEYLTRIADSHTSAYPSFNPSIVEKAGLLLPPEDEQRAIAHILGTLDDKIELNQRMNETLEAIARAIFKSWFVDFEPVRAKMEGRWRRGQSLPGLPAHLYDLFPDRLVDSELGEIPEGWEVRKLSDLCSTQYGYTASAIDEAVGPKFLRVTDINKRNWIEWADVPHCIIEPESQASYALQVGDLVVARMADPGKSAIIEEEVHAVFASYLVRLKTCSLALSYYIYGFLKSDLYTEYAEGTKSGSVQANMNARVIVGASLVVPPDQVMKQFLEVILPLRRHIVSNVLESQTLSAHRDILLPKLISGEIRVKDAKRFLKERGL
jgi:type I restriction enzyme S subunit